MVSHCVGVELSIRATDTRPPSEPSLLAGEHEHTRGCGVDAFPGHQRETFVDVTPEFDLQMG